MDHQLRKYQESLTKFAGKSENVLAVFRGFYPYPVLVLSLLKIIPFQWQPLKCG